MFGSIVRDYKRLGLSVIPLGHWTSGKLSRSPKPSKWQQYCVNLASDEQIDEWVAKFGDNNAGLCTGTPIGDYQLLAIDIDDPEVQEKVERALGALVCGKVGSKGATWFFRASKEVPSKQIKRNKKVMVDVLAAAHQTVIPPSIHFAINKAYYWVGTPLLDLGPENLPILPNSALLEIIDIAKGRDEYFNGGVIKDGDFETQLDGINHMTTAGGKGGGTTHDNRLRSSAYMVSAGWTDEDAITRLDRAMAEAYERAGIIDEMDVDAVHHEHVRMVESARAKGFGDKAERRANKIPKERSMADWAIAEFAPLKCHAGQFIRYGEGHWVEVPQNKIKYAMLQIDPALKSSDVNSAMTNLAILTHDDDFGRRASDKICLLNGTLLVSEGELKRHEAEDEILHQLDFEYEGEQPCPVYDEFIKWMFAGDQESIDCLEEFAGLTLVDDTSFQKMLFLTGRGQNGKSTLSELIMSMHDDDAVSTVPVTSLDDERHRTALVGALINVSTEQSRMSNMSDAIFKQIVAGDPISIRRLYEEVDNKVRLKARLLCLANDLPTISDSSFAMRRRMLILPCPNIIDNSRKDRDLISKLKAERPGILYKWVQALRRLRTRGQFLEPKASIEAVNAYMKENDSVATWVDARMIASKDSWMPAYEAYEEYQEYAKKLGFRMPYRLPHFVSKIKDANVPVRVETTVIEGVTHIETFIGIKHRDSATVSMLKRI